MGSRDDRRSASRRRTRLPQGVEDRLRRAAGKENREQAVTLLENAAEAFSSGDYQSAVRNAEKVKAVAARDEAARELLALALYRMGRWRRALSELRHLRRMSGDPLHVPVELDCLRALGRGGDVDRLWEELADWEPAPEVRKEAAVVYASHLLDEGRPREAWKVIDPKRLPRKAGESDLRQWYVAARVALELGDRATSRQLLDAVSNRDPSLPGLAELRARLETGDG